MLMLTIYLVRAENGLGRYRRGRRTLYIVIWQRQENGCLKSFAIPVGRTNAMSSLLLRMHGKLYAVFRLCSLSKYHC
jgi:hypothetical protein